VCAFALAGALVGSAGCGSDRPAAAGGTVAGEGGAPEGGAADGPRGNDAEACVPPPANNAPIIADELVAATRPTALGGVIAPGLYHLVKSEIYTGAGGRTGVVGTIIQRTVLFTDTSMSYTESEGSVDAGIDESDTQSKTYATNGTTLSFTLACASAAGTFPKGSIEYSVVGDEIHLLLSFSQREVLRPASRAGADAATD
jgi:hypothetical protein